jgi:APA family basic amino acid/polyamine antiporter
MVRTIGTLSGALAIWGGLGLLSLAGALCYAELATRFPRAGGAYVFLQEAYGPRVAFVYGWMALLVMDPGVAAALGIGFGQYLLAALALPATFVTPVAVAALVVFGSFTLLGLNASARAIRWTAVAKLTCVGVLVLAGALRAGGASHASGAALPVTPGALASSIIAAFFAFGGWWDVGRMTEDVEHPRRTMPIALLAGLALVTAIYSFVSVALVMANPSATAASDDVFVLNVGEALFGPTAGRLLAVMVVIAVAGTLTAMLLGAPRLYVAMARDRLFPERLGRFNQARGTSPGGTVIVVALACLLASLGTFDQILGYFVPAAVFFLGLSAAAIFRVRRNGSSEQVFLAPFHPLPVIVFVIFVTAILVLFAAGQPRQTILGALVVAAGIPASFLVIRRARGSGL